MHNIVGFDAASTSFGRQNAHLSRLMFWLGGWNSSRAWSADFMDSASNAVKNARARGGTATRSFFISVSRNGRNFFIHFLPNLSVGHLPPPDNERVKLTKNFFLRFPPPPPPPSPLFCMHQNMRQLDRRLLQKRFYLKDIKQRQLHLSYFNLSQFQMQNCFTSSVCSMHPELK